MCLRASSLYVCACVVVGVYAWIEFICICECLYSKSMRESSLYVYASYSQVYMHSLLT